MKYSFWVVFIVVVFKVDKYVWICRDYKMIVNCVISEEQYLLLNIDDIFVCFVGG